MSDRREKLILFLHLAPDRKGFFRAAKDIGDDVVIVQFAADVAGDLVNDVAGFLLQVMKRRMIEFRPSGLRTRKARSSSSSRIHCIPMRPASGA